MQAEHVDNRRGLCFPFLLYVLSDLPAWIWNGSLGFVIVDASALSHLLALAPLSPDV